MNALRCLAIGLLLVSAGAARADIVLTDTETLVTGTAPLNLSDFSDLPVSNPAATFLYLPLGSGLGATAEINGVGEGASFQSITIGVVDVSTPGVFLFSSEKTFVAGSDGNGTVQLTGLNNTQLVLAFSGVGFSDSNTIFNASFTISPVPEPSSWAVIGVVAAGGIFAHRRRKTA